jgi:hypothetical protein
MKPLLVSTLGRIAARRMGQYHHLRTDLMKKLAITSLLLLTFAPFTTAKDSAQKVTLKGDLVDVSCATDEADQLPELREKHSKKCLQMPACVKSGYAVLTGDDKVYKFDDKGNDEAKKLIASTDKDKKWKIVVKGKLEGDQLSVSKLELDK